ncbi:MAG: MBL fold metallo-hydrolase, partial [Rhizobiaceae bacterium]
MTNPPFRTEFKPHHGEAVPLADDILRVTAPNSGPFTFHGTNSYIVGEKSLVVIDPGPDEDTHLNTLLDAIDGRPVTHIAVTHTHMDHSPLARKLAKITGSTIVAEGMHRAARDLHIGEQNPLDAAADRDFEPDAIIEHGQLIKG